MNCREKLSLAVSSFKESVREVHLGADRVKCIHVVVGSPVRLHTLRDLSGECKFSIRVEPRITSSLKCKRRSFLYTRKSQQFIVECNRCIFLVLPFKTIKKLIQERLDAIWD